MAQGSVWPAKDLRLKRRYWKLVQEHEYGATRVAAGLSALPRTGQSFASAQALWRFLDNGSVCLPGLMGPLLDVARGVVSRSDSGYVLVVHDWSKLSYEHKSKKDLVELPGRENVGYDLSVVLAVDASDGIPIAPVQLKLHCVEGVYSTQSEELGPPVSHVEQVFLSMKAAKEWKLPRRPVHIIDSEGDGLAQYREWSQGGDDFLVRADAGRCVHWEGERSSLNEIALRLQRRGAFLEVRPISYHGRNARQFIAEAEVVLEGPGRKRRPQGRVTIPGPPLALRLVISQVRDEKNRLLAVWFLFTNLPSQVRAETVALWYYWRWRIESFFKLMKSHGLEVEAWLQRDGLRIAKRLLVAAMSCALVWQLQHDPSAEARELEAVLVKISGRLTKRKRPVTTPALVAGLERLLAVLLILEDYTPHQLRQLLARAMPKLVDTG